MEVGSSSKRVEEASDRKVCTPQVPKESPEKGKPHKRPNPAKVIKIGTTLGAEHREMLIQKKWTFSDDKAEPIRDEVNKLLGADAIRDLLFPVGLANVVLVPKPNGTWMMCTDFTSINKACPKDYYPLSNIDRLVDSSAGYKVVDFLVAFRGYHQIFMAEEDVEKTVFETEYGIYFGRSWPSD
ncbi:hypothetical protein LIER_35247 [Lithospermum erythrorhizon]|uniref:Transposon Ty3-I Gag-Pol polyprotein n=1 Tax=Lithospermum erythrorhizon TaxID=34254 RepID=A0AAV3NMA2_LITER